MTNRKRQWWVTTIAIPLMTVGVFAAALAAFMRSVFPETDVAAILFYAANEPLAANTTVVGHIPPLGFGIAVLAILVLSLFDLGQSRVPIHVTFGHSRRMLTFRLRRLGLMDAAIVLTLGLSLLALQLGVPAYVRNQLNPGTFYEHRYVSAENRVTPPTKAGNLVFIYVESLEATLFTRANGGQASEPLIPRLEAMALDPANVSFSHQATTLGGTLPAEGATWSLGAMTAMSSGVPLKPAISNGMSHFDSYLPGATFLSDILSRSGYEQTFIVGSDSRFGGIDKMMRTHGDVSILDPNSLKASGKLAPDYQEWWGFEDRKLFEFARDEANRLASTQRPFALTLFAEDTHPPNGYLDKNCAAPMASKYDNVHLCTSNQVADYIEWVRKQPFGADTTIVVVGDHLNMQTSYYKYRVTDRDYKRTTYNVIINSAVTTARTKGRQFTSLDIYPTTLAAMGFEIKGNRLGLGVNLFSDEKTLAEELGIDTLNSELARRSVFYDDVLMGGG